MLLVLIYLFLSSYILLFSLLRRSLDLHFDAYVSHLVRVCVSVLFITYPGGCFGSPLAYMGSSKMATGPFRAPRDFQNLPRECFFRISFEFCSSNVHFQHTFFLFRQSTLVLVPGKLRCRSSHAIQYDVWHRPWSPWAPLGWLFGRFRATDP